MQTERPTSEQIKQEIAALQNVRPRVRRRNTFGEDNWEKIDAQIAVLSEHLTEDDIYDRWPDDEKDFETRISAIDALNWRNGEYEFGGLSEGWEEIAISRPA